MATVSSILSSSSFALPFLISNIGSLISIKLENHNYLLWKSQFLPVLRVNNLEGFVDGSLVCPYEFLLDSEGKIINKIRMYYVGSMPPSLLVFLPCGRPENVQRCFASFRAKIFIFISLSYYPAKDATSDDQERNFFYF